MPTDTPVTISSINNADTQVEGNDITFGFTRTGGDISQPFDAFYTAFLGSGGRGGDDATLADFAGANVPDGTVKAIHFDAGSTTASVVFQTLDDAVQQGGQRVFTVEVQTSPNYTIGGDGRTTKYGFILDNDAPTFSIADGVARESDGVIHFPVTLSHAADADLTLQWIYQNANRSDINAEFGFHQFTIPAGETTYDIAIPLVIDDVSEPDENFTVSVSRVAGPGSNGDTEATGTITEIPPPTISSINNADTQVEGGIISFGFTRSGDTARALDVLYSTHFFDPNGGPGFATLADFTGANVPDGTVKAIHFDAGSSTASISFQTIDNTVQESTHQRSFTVQLQTSSNYILPDDFTKKFGFILDNDQPPPAITSNGGGDTAAASIAENGIAVTTVTATDPSARQGLGYALAGGLDATKFAIDGVTGALTFVTAPDFENPTDNGANNIYDVIVQVTDGYGKIDTQALAIAVQNVGGVTIPGNNTSQTLNGTGEEDTISGLGGIDTISGFAGIDHLNGGAADDTLIGGLDADFLDGGAGTDKASYASSIAGVAVSLMPGIVGHGGDAEGDILTAIENLIGSGQNDTLEGNNTNNVLDGRAGFDTISYEHAGAGVTVSLAVTAAQSTVGAGQDTLISFENLTGSAFNDVLIGTTGANTIIGAGGADKITGGGGADILTGGLGADTFFFNAPSDSAPATATTITDFDFQHADHIDLSAIDANTSAKKDQAFLFAGHTSNAVAHSVTWCESSGNTIVQADVDGNTTADLTIILTGIDHNLTGLDFLL
ncbi:hypothetical protein CK222_10675 [Mesorhizobium sp. WSM3866]|uniref:calcium-binding protein n=1 Tax=Mesorhizobium sp. WSM3866 TaxID=422271 RepID=UPI000BB04C40|nr:Calx-beta domain-containing protein [Mesorhizobium sp. WSM3866]PBB43255.1 hypothetical protein CK222_10675 [Mesorhizobium sp. WSM3866]